MQTDTSTVYPSLSIRQVARRLGISSATVHRLMNRGEGPPSYRIGRRRLWRETDLIAWLEAQREDAIAS